MPEMGRLKAVSDEVESFCDPPDPPQVRPENMRAA
jgi:hypothetical protein